MPSKTFFPRTATAFAIAAMLSLTLPLASFAQGVGNQTASASSPPGPLVIQIQTPNNGYAASGNITVTGTALDCTSGQAATRVAVYDGPTTANNAYLADVSMDTTEQVGNFCAGRSGSDRVGFTLIYDTHPLADGQHLLTFMAQYPNGGSQSTQFSINTSNGTMVAGQPYGNNDAAFQGHYYDNYGSYGGYTDANYQGNYYSPSPDNSAYNNNYYNQSYAGFPYASPNGVNAVYGNGVVATNGGLNTSGTACVSADVYGNCLQYQNTGTVGAQCISVDTNGNCLQYQNTGAVYGGAQAYGCPSYVSVQDCLNAQGGVYQGTNNPYQNGNCVMTAQGVCAYYPSGTAGASQYVVTCPGIPNSQCLYNSNGQYTRIN